MTDPTPRTDLLLVSDDEDLCSELAFAVPLDVEVRCARDAREAWDAVSTRVPDIAVVEIRSGSAGGFALAREMSYSTGSMGVPILMLLERMQDRWLAEQAGATIALEQPVAPAEIARHVEVLLAELVEPVA